MKPLVTVGIIGCIIGTLTLTNFLENLVFFILTGHVSALDLTLSPIFMLLFWLLIIPSAVLSYKLLRGIFWIIIGFIGKYHQRHINNSLRLAKKPLNLPKPVINLVVIYAINLKGNSSSKSKKASVPDLSLRRRFITITV